MMCAHMCRSSEKKKKKKKNGLLYMTDRERNKIGTKFIPRWTFRNANQLVRSVHWLPGWKYRTPVKYCNALHCRFQFWIFFSYSCACNARNGLSAGRVCVLTKLEHLPSESHTHTRNVWLVPDAGAGVHAVRVQQSIGTNANIDMVRNPKRKESERY